MWDRRRCILVATGALVVVTAVAGCTVKSGSDGISASKSSTTSTESSTTTSRPKATTTTRPAPTTTTAAPTTTLAPPTSAGRALARVGLQLGQLPPGFTIKLYQDGNVVSGQVTLDLCGATFASENRRRARHQIGVIDSAGKYTALSSEAVLYDSEGGARQALAEIAAAKAQCPPGFVNSDVGGVPPLKFTFGAAPDAGWPQTPGVTRLALALTVTDQQGHQYSSIEVFQQRGAIFVGFYVSDPGPTLADLAPTAGGYRGVTLAIARSLAALPASAVAGNFPV